MLALYRADRQADALASYRDARAALDELGLEPSASLRTLERRILEHDPTLAAPDHKLHLPGERRRRSSGASSSWPRSRRFSADPMRGSSRSRARAVPGKPCCPAAASKHGAHAFVDLAPLTDPALVLATIGRAFGVEEDPDLPLLEQVAGVFDTDTRLVVLDNLEHLSEAFADIGRLLAAARAPDTRDEPCPASPRRRARVRVEPLAAPALGVTDVGELRAIASVRLYVDRAREAVDGFELSDANASHVARICRALDGLPLAVELAAARVRVLGPEGTARGSVRASPSCRARQSTFPSANVRSGRRSRGATTARRRLARGLRALAISPAVPRSTGSRRRASRKSTYRPRSRNCSTQASCRPVSPGMASRGSRCSRRSAPSRRRSPTTRRTPSCTRGSSTLPRAAP